MKKHVILGRGAPRKFELRRETIVRLTPDQLRAVEGGSHGPLSLLSCADTNCPSTE